MQDTENTFGTVSRINHALTAVVLIALLAIGLYFEDLPRGDEKVYWLKLHISIGATAWLFLLFRLYWRFKQGFPMPFAQARVLQRVTHAVHGLLLLGIAILIVTGPIAVWTDGRAIGVFGLISIPSPTGESHDLHTIFGGIHGFVANTMIGLIVIHVLGAIKHLIKDRKEFLGRMIGKRS